MSPAKKLTPVRRLREHQEQQCAQALAAAQQSQQEREKKLCELRDYLSEYENRARDNVNPLLLANHHAFISRLRHAIGSQARVVESARFETQSARAHWLHAKRDRAIVDELVSAHNQAAARRALAQTQEAMDECAQRGHRRSPI